MVKENCIDEHHILGNSTCTTFSEPQRPRFDIYRQPSQYGSMGSIEQSSESRFKKIQNFKADYTDAEFTQYESQRTGMRVVVVDRKGPKVC